MIFNYFIWYITELCMLYSFASGKEYFFQIILGNGVTKITKLPSSQGNPWLLDVLGLDDGQYTLCFCSVCNEMMAFEKTTLKQLLNRGQRTLGWNFLNDWWTKHQEQQQIQNNFQSNKVCWLSNMTKQIIHGLHTILHISVCINTNSHPTKPFNNLEHRSKKKKNIEYKLILSWRHLYYSWSKLRIDYNEIKKLEIHQVIGLGAQSLRANLVARKIT